MLNMIRCIFDNVRRIIKTPDSVFIIALSTNCRIYVLSLKASLIAFFTFVLRERTFKDHLL